MSIQEFGIRARRDWQSDDYERGDALLFFLGCVGASHPFCAFGLLSPAQLLLSQFYNQCSLVKREKPFSFHQLLQYNGPTGAYMVWLSLDSFHVNQAVWLSFFISDVLGKNI